MQYKTKYIFLLIAISVFIFFTIMIVEDNDSDKTVTDKRDFRNSPKIMTENDANGESIRPKEHSETLKKGDKREFERVLPLERANFEEKEEYKKSSVIESKYNLLAESSDPIEKRKLRKEIALLQPADKVLDYLLGNYQDIDNEGDKLQIQSIVAQINPGAEIYSFEREASITSDEALFVSLVYALRKAGNVDAKKALLNLLENNSLSPTSTDFLTNVQGVGVIYQALQDTVTPEDAVWMNNYIESNGASDKQIFAIANSIGKYPSMETLATLETAKYYTQSMPLKEKIDAITISLKQQLENIRPIP